MAIKVIMSSSCILDSNNDNNNLILEFLQHFPLKDTKNLLRASSKHADRRKQFKIQRPKLHFSPLIYSF
jgi:hypothetical protein